MNKIYYELCPYCEEEEEVKVKHDISKGLEVICPKCNCGILLCSMCKYTETQTDGECDWYENECRMRIIKKEIK